jgi:hypothetical protein
MDRQNRRAVGGVRVEPPPTPLHERGQNNDPQRAALASMHSQAVPDSNSTRTPAEVAGDGAAWWLAVAQRRSSGLRLNEEEPATGCRREKTFLIGSAIRKVFSLSVHRGERTYGCDIEG